MRPYLKKPFTKKDCGVAQGVGPELKPQYQKKKIVFEIFFFTKTAGKKFANKVDSIIVVFWFLVVVGFELRPCTSR
jgi:hypothetical protein